jgi:outer membrane cobalamin receptor
MIQFLAMAQKQLEALLMVTFFSKEWLANINYGTGFRALTFNELYYPGSGNAALAPESNRNLEAGLHQETKVYDLHLVVFQNDVQNLFNGSLKLQTSMACGGQRTMALFKYVAFRLAVT